MLGVTNLAPYTFAVHKIARGFFMEQNKYARADVRGGTAAPGLRGRVEFFDHPDGTLVTAQIWGLPASETAFFALHIHDGGSCGGADFADTGGHFNPGNSAHPMHAGDLPPLLSVDGNAWLSVLTGRFRVEDVVGKTVVIHSHPDDFHTQPAGNAGEKIACGTIKFI